MTNICILLNHSNFFYFMTNGYGVMLVIIFIMMPYLFFYYQLKEKNLKSQGEQMAFWSTKGSGMLLGGGAMYLYKFISDYIFKLPPIFISVFVIVAFLPFLMKEIKIRNCVLEYESQKTFVEPELTLLPKQPPLKENPTVAQLKDLADKHPCLKKVIVIILSPIVVFQVLRKKRSELRAENAYYSKQLKGRPIFKWNSAKLKKEIGKIKKKEVALERAIKKEEQIKKRTKPTQ